MTPEDKMLAELSELLIRLMDNSLTAEEFQRLQTLLREHPLARQYYFDLLTTVAGMEEIQEIASAEEEWVTALLGALAENERTATAVPVEKPSEKQEKSETQTKPAGPAVSKLSLYALLLSSAALLMLMAYALWVSGKPTGVEVATLTDCIDAKWSLPYSPQKGMRLMTDDEPIQMLKGFVKVQTDSGAQLILEAPAEFRFRSGDELAMSYGRIFVNVAGAPNGFTVQTQKSKIIDLGTQFGVYTDLRGDSELHVFEGKTVLIAGLANQQERLLDVPAGQACLFGQKKETIVPIPLSADTFAKWIDSEVGLIWRGQKEISLADVVGGGNGFGTGQADQGIRVETAAFGKPECRTRRTGNGYFPVSASVFVDGIFVPDGGREQTVSSTGLIFGDCPKTSGFYFMDPVSTPSTVRSRKNPKGLPIRLGDTDYSQPAHPCLFLHSNLGITFDLQAFTSRLPGVEIAEFRSEIGISDTAERASSAVFWVLVDGQVRYRKDVQKRGPADIIRIPLEKTDRFLTLMTTDAGDLEPEWEDNPNGYDWCVWGKPILILK